MPVEKTIITANFYIQFVAPNIYHWNNVQFFITSTN